MPQLIWTKFKQVFLLYNLKISIYVKPEDVSY